MTRFVGRQAELAELEQFLQSSPALTVVGAPGVGKTRLVLELAERVRSGFADGVQVVEMASISDAATVTHAVASAFGVDARSRSSPSEALVDTLMDAELLLVLDNCEHLVAPAAAMMRSLAVSCPGVRVLATSRVGLGVTGERVWSLAPLDLDSAVELFLDRAALASSNFRVEGVERDRLRRIGALLGGLPLAVELAAPLTRVLSLGQIEAFLADVAAHGGGEYATMRSTVDWSYRLLEPSAQRLFARLSVFAGGFDLAAVEAVAAPGDDALANLTALVDHSLVEVEPEVEPDTAGEPMRYRMLEPLRQCGEEILQAGDDLDEAQRVHAQHYLGATAGPKPEQPQPRRPRDLRLERERDNLLQAMEWARRHGSELGLQAFAMVASWCEFAGFVKEGRAWMDDMLRVDTADRQVRATALASHSRIAWRQGDYESARASLEESLAIQRELGGHQAVARRLRSLANIVAAQGDVTTALGLCDQSVDIFRAEDDRRGLAWSLIYRGGLRYATGDNAGGDEDLREALVVGQQTEDHLVVWYAWLMLAYGAAMAGDVESLRGHLVEVHRVCDEAGGVAAEPEWIWVSFHLAAAERRIPAALRLAGGAEEVSRRSGSRPNPWLRLLPTAETLTRLRQQVGQVQADRLMEEGSQMSLQQLGDQALAALGDEPDDPFSPREREVAQLVAEGLRNTDIATKLFISRRTVESHVEHIRQKLGLETRHQIMTWIWNHDRAAAPQA